MDMENSTSPEPTPSRQELEDIWRSKLEEAQLHYEAAREEYRKLLRETPDGSPNPDSPQARACQRESEALAEYTRVLRIFTDLTIHGKRPEKQTEADLIAIDDDASVRNAGSGSV